MKNNKLVAFAMAGAMMAGTLASAMPVMAEGSTTQINLDVAAPTYELVVPAKLDVASSGYNAFTEGITVRNLKNASDDDMTVKVTAESANDWKLKNGDNTISYKLVSSDAQDTQIDALTFSELANMKETTGQTIGCGINVESYKSKTAGSYSDTITWKASVGTASIKDMFTKGAEVELEVVDDSTTYHYVIVNNSSDDVDGMGEIKSITVNGTSETDTLTTHAHFMTSNSEFELSRYNSSYSRMLIVYAEQNTYYISTIDSTDNFSLTSFKVNGREYIDTLTKQ